MQPDDHVCLCFRVSLRKLVNYMERERPSVPSQLSDCLGAGTGCHWCVPFLCALHKQWREGKLPSIDASPANYAEQRAAYRHAIGDPARPTDSGDPSGAS